MDLGLNTNHDKTQTQDYPLTTTSSDTATNLFDSQEETEDYQTNKTQKTTSRTTYNRVKTHPMLLKV